MSVTNIQFEVDEETATTLDEIAGNMDVDRSSVVREAISFYLAAYERLNAEVDEVEKDIDMGKWISQNEMETRFEDLVRRAPAA